MRTVVMAWTIALVASQHVNLVPEFEATQTYVYKYEALLFSGLHQEGLARAGIKINSKVFISAAAENTFLLKISNPQLFEYSGIWPTDSFSATKFTSELTAQLQIPIKFEYTSGAVGRVFAPAAVSDTVINLHRGVLNILQLNLKKTENIYEVQEAGIQGVCNTQYLISEDEKNHRISITKSRDLALCHKRIIKDIGLAYIETCNECQQRVKSLSGAVTYSYIMRPTPTGVLITEATVQELHHLIPLHEISDAIQMESRQTFALSEIIKTPIVPISADYLLRGSLQYEFSTEIFWIPIQLMKISDPQAQIVDALNHLATKNQGEVHEDVPLKFIELIQLMRFASLDAIEGIWVQFKTRTNVRKWILDAVPAVGTFAALKFIKQTFLADELSIPEFAQALLATVHIVTANLDTVKLFSGLALNHKVQEIPVLREVAMLGYGTMIARHCAAVLVCPVELLKPILETAAEATAKADTAVITLVLKVLGNAGHPAGIKHIINFLPVNGTPLHAFPISVQVEAILALKAIAKKEPKLVQEVVLQLFMNKEIHPELRMVSWIVLFETKPSMGLVTTLARSLQKETNLQVASLAYSHIKALTRSTSPELTMIAAACNVAIKILNPKLDKLSYHYSKALHLDTYATPLMVGAAASVFIINDAATILPRAVLVKARAYLAGAAADVIEVGIRANGIQEALLKSPMMNEDMLPRMKRVLNALTAFKALPKKQPMGSIYIKFLGQEMAFANVDKAVVEQAIKFGIGRIPQLAEETLKAMQNGIAFQYTKPLLVAEIRRIFPSAAGVPMELSLCTAAVGAATLQVQTIITPPVTETISVAHLMKTDVKLTAKVSPSMALHTFAVMGVNTGLIQATSIAKGKIKTFLPLKVEANFDIPKANFKIEAFPMVLPVHVTTARFETLAAAGSIKEINAERITPIVPETVVVQHSQEMLGSRISAGDLSSEMVHSDVLPVKEPELKTGHSVHKTLCSVLPHIGIKACMEVMSCTAAFIKNTTFYNMIGQHGVHIVIARADGPAVERLEFEVQVGPRAAKKLPKEIKIGDIGIPQVNTILQKLREMLAGGQGNSSSAGPFSHHKLFSPQSIISQSIGSSSSVSSSSSHPSKERFLGDSVAPMIAIIARVVRVDRKLLGYQFAAYFDKPTERVQFIVASIAVHDNWKMCVDGVFHSKHKVAAKIAWGAECQQYVITIKAETGLFGPNPATHLKVKCEKVPTIITTFAKRHSEYILEAALWAGLVISKAKNSKRQIELTLAMPTDRTLDIIVKIPKMTLSKSGLVLPIALPFDDAYPEDDVMNMVWNLYTEASSAKCSMVRNTLTTFNNRKYINEIPLSCSQLLAQDCTSEHTFMVLLKKKDVSEQEHLNIKVADIDVDMYHKDNAIKVKVNEFEVPTNSLPYQHSTGTIRIAQKGKGISLYARAHGLQEVYFAKDQWKLDVVDWMRGQTCGLCGRADGETRQEYRTPSGYLTRSSVSFVHSWVLHAESCSDDSQCHMKLESVKLERLMSDKQVSICYAVEPVLHCLPGCLPVSTSHITVGYYCLPSDSKLNHSENLSSIYEKTIDLRETTETHLACHCTEECV